MKFLTSKFKKKCNSSFLVSKMATILNNPFTVVIFIVTIKISPSGIKQQRHKYNVWVLNQS